MKTTFVSEVEFDQRGLGSDDAYAQVMHDKLQPLIDRDLWLIGYSGLYYPVTITISKVKEGAVCRLRVETSQVIKKSKKDKR